MVGERTCQSPPQLNQLNLHRADASGIVDNGGGPTARLLPGLDRVWHRKQVNENVGSTPSPFLAAIVYKRDVNPVTASVEADCICLQCPWEWWR